MKSTLNRAQLNALYQPPADQFIRITVPELPFLMMEIDGTPDPAQAQSVAKWLYTAIHPIRQKAKKDMGKNFLEPPLEALYAVQQDKVTKWRMMIILPDELDPTFLDECLAKVTDTLGPAAGKVFFERFEEGPCVQTMHIGDLDSQKEKVDALYHSFLPEHGLTPHGWYHEIYLNDHQRVAPEKRRTILRQAIRTR